MIKEDTGMQETLPRNYAELDRLLQAAGADSSAAEAHGLLCGMTCAGGRCAGSIWLAHLLGEDNTLSAAAQDCGNALASLQKDILRQFNDDAMGFTLLLPADDEPLAPRTLALSQWCAGFLYGVALGGIRDDAPLPNDSAEILKDFYEISHAGFAPEGTQDADEAAYQEIVEYVRMCVLLIHEELCPLPGNPRLQ
jgi:yecA family protein